MLKIGKAGGVCACEGGLIGALAIDGLGLEGDPLVGVQLGEICRGEKPGGNLGEILLYNSKQARGTFRCKVCVNNNQLRFPKGGAHNQPGPKYPNKKICLLI